MRSILIPAVLFSSLLTSLMGAVVAPRATAPPPPPADVYWSPQSGSTNGNLASNWSIADTGYSPASSLSTSTNLHFSGNGTNAGNCTITANIGVGSIISPPGFTKTFSDGGNTLTVNGGLSMQSGTLNMSGLTILNVPGATTVNLLLPSGQALHALTAYTITSAAVNMQSDIIVGSMTVNGTGTWLWNFNKVITITGSSNANFTNGVLFGQVSQSPNSAKIIWQGSGGTLTLPSGQEMPKLQVTGTVNLDKTGSGPLLLGNLKSLALGAGATLNLYSDLVLQNGATFVQASSSTINSGGGNFIWRKNADFPAPGGTTITAPVRIEQVANSTTQVGLPGGWNFTNGLTLVATENFVEAVNGTDLPDLVIDLQGAVTASSIDFIATSTDAPNIDLYFVASGARLSANNAISSSSSQTVSVNWNATTGVPITVSADTLLFADGNANVSLNFDGSTESADLTVHTSIDTTTFTSASDVVHLELDGPGDGSGIVQVTIPDFTWDISKSGSAQVISVDASATIQSFTSTSPIDCLVKPGFTGATWYLIDNSLLAIGETGSTNGNLTISLDLTFSAYNSHSLRNDTSDAILELSGDLVGDQDSPTDIYAEAGEIRISGTDSRVDYGEGTSHTYITGSGTILNYLGNGPSIAVVATGSNVQLRGSGTLASFASTSSDPVSVMPGGFLGQYDTLTIGDADMRSASTAPVEMHFKAFGGQSPGSDHDQLATTDLYVQRTQTSVQMDLQGWSGSGRIDGLITYSNSLNGDDPSLLPITVVNGVGLSVELVSDVANKEIDLVVTASTPTDRGTFRTPVIPVSTRRSLIWSAISPGTAEGLTNLRNRFDTLSTEQARAFIWDASTQLYVEYPAQPVGGLQPWQGWFVATTIPISLDFRGTFSGTPHRVPLLAGWNLIGVGPVNDNGPIAAFPFNILELRDDIDAIITDSSSPSRSAIIGDHATWWNSHSYTTTTTFVSGRAYWVYQDPNASTADHELVYVAGAIVTDPGPINEAALNSVAARTQPPAPPQLGKSAETPKGGGGCGGGSAFGFLIAILAMGGLRRQRK